jgi:hypothetical protein
MDKNTIQVAISGKLMIVLLFICKISFENCCKYSFAHTRQVGRAGYIYASSIKTIGF